MMNIARRSVAAALVLCVMTGAAASPGRKSSKKEAEDVPPAPALHLDVSPRHGFRPLTITMTGTLTGVATTDPDYCHAGIEWESRTPDGLIYSSKQDARCLHPPEQVDVQLSFSKVVTLSRPGVYEYRMTLYRRDGSKLLSNTQEVTVLDNL